MYWTSIIIQKKIAISFKLKKNISKEFGLLNKSKFKSYTLLMKLYIMILNSFNLIFYSVKYQNFSIKKKLTNLFKFNKKNLAQKNNDLLSIISNIDLIKYIYNKLKYNPKNSILTKKVKIIDKINLNTLQHLSNYIKTINYQVIKIKKNRNKNIFSFKHQIIQKLVEIILNIIYKPIFKNLAYNYIFKDKKNIQFSIHKLKIQNQEWTYAFKSKIEKYSKILNTKILLTILKKKITDFKFLQFLKHIVKKKAFLIDNTIYFILFNIYIHEFDLYLSKKIKHTKSLKNLDVLESYKKNVLKVIKAKQKLFCYKKIFKFNIKIFHKLKKYIKKIKKKHSNWTISNKRGKKIYITYTRYNNNWIILTNFTFYKKKKLKSKLMSWFNKNLKVELNQIWLINLIQNKLNYLGFTFFISSPKIKTIYYKNKFRARRKNKITLSIGMDHQYMKNKLIKKKILTSNYKPNNINNYYNLKPFQILRRFKQKLEILIKYYYGIITFPNDLAYYHYIYKFSCLKTLAYKIKKSITYTSNVYLNDLKIEQYMFIKTSFSSYLNTIYKIKSFLNNCN